MEDTQILHNEGKAMTIHFMFSNYHVAIMVKGIRDILFSCIIIYRLLKMKQLAYPLVVEILQQKR